MKVSFEIREIVDVNASFIFNAWLNSEMHSEMTGGLAVCSNEINGEFSACDGYITGRNIDLIPNKKLSKNGGPLNLAILMKIQS